MGEEDLGPSRVLLPTGHIEKLELSLVAALVVESVGRTEGQEVDSEGLWGRGCWGREDGQG